MICDVCDVYVCSFLVDVDDVVDNLGVALLFLFAITSIFTCLLAPRWLFVLATFPTLFNINFQCNFLSLGRWGSCHFRQRVRQYLSHARSHLVLWLKHLRRIVLPCLICVVVSLVRFHVDLIALARCCSPTSRTMSLRKLRMMFTNI